MSSTFSKPQAWVYQLTSALLAVLPTDFTLVDEADDRHGSWEWIANDASRWLVLSATPLSDPPPQSTERPSVEVAAWQLTADASRIVGATVGRLTVEARNDRDGEAMARAVAIVVTRALGTPRTKTQGSMAITLATGEALVGDGNELAHIDLLIGSKNGPVGAAFASAFTNESEGHTNLLAVVTANLPAKPDTVITNKVTIKGEKQAVQLFGPAQAAVARAVVDSVAEGVIPKDQVDDLCLIVGVFIHWEAADDKKIYDYNYQAVKLALARALEGYPSVDKVLADTPAARHPFASGR